MTLSGLVPSSLLSAFFRANLEETWKKRGQKKVACVVVSVLFLFRFGPLFSPRSTALFLFARHVLQ